MPSVGSHTGKCVITSNNEKKKQTERAGETDCFNYPLTMLLENLEKSIVQTSSLYKEVASAKNFFFQKIRINALIPACPVESRNQCMVKIEGKSWKPTRQENKQYDYHL